jgi:hypothetical protein
MRVAEHDGASGIGGEIPTSLDEKPVFGAESDLLFAGDPDIGRELGVLGRGR